MKKKIVSTALISFLTIFPMSLSQQDNYIFNQPIHTHSPTVQIQQIQQIPENNYIEMQATAYDLSIQSCGKSYKNPSRGITKSGYNLSNKSRKEAMTVSSNRFPIETKLLLEFPESHEKYNGCYIVRDTGNFRNNVLDIYLGDFGEKVSREVIKFGKVNLNVKINE